ncbi:hypothetical protein H0H87_000192 [Tephrocybe sp. NHM501043]|nr:hypothetical protein H0H87_000192 [Tephrocybe sp. NHM501043]
MFWSQPASSTPPPSVSYLMDAPGDLLIEIALALDSRADILNLCLTNSLISPLIKSSLIYSHVAAVLYETVILNDVEQCTTTLLMLSKRPLLARHVRELIVRPRSSIDFSRGVSVSLLASMAVRDAAVTQRLDALSKFIWDADEKPYHEDMWFALRMGCVCQLLRDIRRVVEFPFHLGKLFDFANLTGFSLTLKHGFYDTHMDTFLDEDNASSRLLWDMLIHRCPDLEELVIEGASTLPTDVHTLVDGRWPKLRKLILGDVSIDWTPASTPASTEQPDKRPFIAFLEAHPSLESLSLSRYNVLPSHLSSIEPGSLHITSFTGTLQQLQALPYLQSHLRSVTFRDPMQTREISAQAVAALLQSLPNLTELTISFELHSMYDSGNLLRALIAACPHLRYLNLTCCNKPSFQMEAFSKTVRGFPKLQTLHLTIVKYPGDESIASGAVRIAKANPRLTKFNLTFIPPTYPLPLPFALPHPPFPFPIHSTGSFQLTTDRHGLPHTLVGLEHFRLIWPWGLGVSSSSRRYVCDLHPLSAPGRRKNGWRGVLSLLTESSAAGEEMRMIVFCGLLVSLAVWGYSAHRTKPGEILMVVPRPAVRGVLSLAPITRMAATA